MRTAKRWAPLVLAAICVAYLWIDGSHLVSRVAYAAARGADKAQREQLATLAGGDTLSPLFVQVAKVTKPAVVEVRVTKMVTLPTLPDMDQFFRRFFGEQGAPFGDQGSPFNTPSTPRGPSPRQRQFTERGLGSGVIIDAKEGYVLTNYHVVAGADKTEVRMPDGKTLVVEWARTDPMSDLAVLKVKGDNFSEVPLGDSDAIQVGDWVLAIGSPEGLPQTVTSGIISAKGRSTGEAATYQSFLQTDAAINHGNSGGPLVNMHGEVVGITTAIVSESGGNEGIGFAIPSNMAKTVMTQLIKTGKVVRGYLGVAIQAADEDIKESFHLPTTAGALVAGVTPDSPAAKAGLKKGDFITTVDGTKVDNVNDLRNLVAGLPPGKVATIELYRDGKKMTVEATIQAQPANFLTAAGGQTPQETPGQPATADRFGLEVASPTAELAQHYGYKTPPAGVIITNVVSGSPAEEKGLRDGMAITEVGNQAVNSADEFKKAISSEEAAKSVRLYVTNPAGAEHIVVLKPKE